MISIIVAVAENYAIGRKGDLLCHLPADLRYFKTVTQGHTVIMGKRTYLSLPRRPLPNRQNIVITDIEGEQIDGATTVYSIEQAIAAAPAAQENFIIGGGMVYRQFMPLADRLYITHIHHAWPDADTLFPTIDPALWEEVSAERHAADENNPYDYTFAVYERRAQ